MRSFGMKFSLTFVAPKDLYPLVLSRSDYIGKVLKVHESKFHERTCE